MDLSITPELCVGQAKTREQRARGKQRRPGLAINRGVKTQGPIPKETFVANNLNGEERRRADIAIAAVEVAAG
jgi:hypothetical protein